MEVKILIFTTHHSVDLNTEEIQMTVVATYHGNQF